MLTLSYTTLAIIIWAALSIGCILGIILVSVCGMGRDA